jgi:hypothetical protein
LAAAGGADDDELLKENSELMFDGRRWLAVGDHSEEMLCKLFILIARQGAGSYELLHCRHRTWPYKVFEILKDDAVADWLDVHDDCELDEFTLHFRQYYGKGNCTGESAKAELATLAAVCKTDTASTERWHSRNQRRAKFRVWSHTQDLDSLSAKFLGMRTRDSGVRRTDDGERAKRRRQAPYEAAKQQEKLMLTSHRYAGGAWRAFMHMMAAGRRITPQLSAVMSEEYRALSPEQKEYYRELGALAVLAREQGDPGLVHRVRNRPDRIFELDGRDVDAGQDSDERHLGQQPALPAMPGAASGNVHGYSRIIAEASLQKANAKSDLDLETAENALLQKEVDQWSSEKSASAIQGWSAVSSAATDAASSTSSSSSLVRLQHAHAFVEHRRDLGQFALDVVQSSLKSSAIHRSRVWQGLHTAIMLKDCDSLGKVPTRRRRCHEAQRCLCQGLGRIIDRLETRLRAAFTLARKALGDKAFLRLLKGGMMALRFEFATPADRQPNLVVADAADDGDGPPVAEAKADLWVHIALMYLSPWRPTFLLMARHPGSDRGESLGLEARREESDASRLAFRTLWEVVGDCLDVHLEIAMSWYRLAFTSKRTGDSESPHRQRVLPLSLDKASLWRGLVSESKRQKASSGRKGGGRLACNRPPMARGDNQADESAEIVDSDASIGSVENDERQDLICMFFEIPIRPWLSNQKPVGILFVSMVEHADCVAFVLP